MTSPVDIPRQAPRFAEELHAIEGADAHTKIDLIQTIYEGVEFHDSGIMYSMQYLDEAGIRPFVESDFPPGIPTPTGTPSAAAYLHGENSLMAAGWYLAAQSFRFRATQAPEALEQARKALRSLCIVYDLGVKAGRTGWMCKPYGFQYSEQTSGDQYLAACYGLYHFQALATPEEREQIRKMVCDFADYWISIDHVYTYHGNSWDQKCNLFGYNAIHLMVCAWAYAISGDVVYRDKAEEFKERALWHKTTQIEQRREQANAQIAAGEDLNLWANPRFPFANQFLQPGEILCWEQVSLSTFVFAAVDILQGTCPELLPAEPATFLDPWFHQWKYGMPEEDFHAYYWFAVDLVKDTWRPLPSTEPGPKEEWPFGNLLLSYVSQMRWNDPLARNMNNYSIALSLVPELREEAGRLIHCVMDKLKWQHLLWIYDPDGNQLLKDLRDRGRCLSSEVPASVLAAWWRLQLEERDDGGRGE